MYAEHIAEIAPVILASSEIFKRALLFVIASIRQPFEKVPEIAEDFLAHGSESRHAWGWKRESVDFILQHYYTLWSLTEKLKTAEDVIAALLVVPGLGVVKAAFVAQLMGYDVACLDSRNNKREGRPLTAFRVPKANPRALIKSYVAQTMGQAERYWNEWCWDVANARPLIWANGEEVSAAHLWITET